MWVRPSGSPGASGGHRGCGRLLDGVTHEGTDARLGLRPEAPAIAQIAHKMRIVQRRPSERDGRHAAGAEELLHVPA